MISNDDSRMLSLAIHYTGNKTNGEDLIVSKTSFPVADERLQKLLLHYFLGAFSQPEYYHFTFSNEDFSLNPLYHYAAQIFDSPASFHTQSIHIAKHLYECADHPNIKSGELFVVHLSDVGIGGESAELIGLFKSEQKQSFLRLFNNPGNINVEADAGINVDKPDKGCLIINTERDKGFKVCIIDKANKTEAQYWKDKFLQLKPVSDDYHQTRSFLDVARHFVTQQFPEDFEVTKADQIDLLNRSVTYFKDNDTFEKESFEQEVFGDERIIRSFRNFDQSWREEHELDIPDSFDISTPALKKQMRVFRSVLKLDRNFHIYIHGDRELIEQGIDPDGRKFYKIYFEEET